MKKTTLLLTLLTIIFLSFSCKKEVQSCIELSSNSILPGQSITFTSCSKNELSYDWRITGPEMAPENNLGWSDKEFTRTFTDKGNYTITLKAYSDFSLIGDVSTSTANFSVN